MHYDSIPQDFSTFLHWLKEQTEKTWDIYPIATLADYRRRGVVGREWQRGTKWIGGYSEPEVSSFENIWQIKFPPTYRQFLRTLGAPDRPMVAAWFNKSDVVWGEKPSFFDWRKNIDVIKDTMAWPLDGILFDVEQNNLWMKSWGPRPNQPEERKLVLTNLIKTAPSLIPITGHRYILGGQFRLENPVLSVYQSDIICYGSDLREFLILELRSLLRIEGGDAHWQATKGINQTALESIPFWGELLAL